MEQILKVLREWFIEKRPFVSWSLLALILAPLPPLSVLVFIVGLVFYGNKVKRLKAEKKQAMINEVNHYVEKIKTDKEIPTITTSIMLQKNEYAFLEENTKLMETRAVRKTNGGGVGFRVAKGVYVGGYSGQSESHQEWRAIDHGRIVLTNKKLIFLGGKENRTIPVEDIISVEPFTDGFQLAISSRQKANAFHVSNPFLWAILIQLINKVDDPKKLDNIDLNVKVIA